MKAYDLEIPIGMRVLPFVALTVMTIAIPAIIFSSGAPAFLAVVVLAIASWNWWVLATLAHRIVVHEDGVVEWVALGRRVRVQPEQIQEIRPDRSGGLGFFMAKCGTAKVRFINQITGFHEVLVHIKGRNPRVVLKGC
jgi:hypothetical protein